MVDKITIALADLEEPKETPYSADSRILKLNHPLNKISNLQDSNCHSLTLHPLVTSLYNAKWKRIGFYFYYGNLCKYHTMNQTRHRTKYYTEFKSRFSSLPHIHASLQYLLHNSSASLHIRSK